MASAEQKYINSYLKDLAVVVVVEPLARRISNMDKLSSTGVEFLRRSNVSLDWPTLEGKPKNAEGGEWPGEGTALLNTRNTRGPFVALLGLFPGV